MEYFQPRKLILVRQYELKMVFAYLTDVPTSLTGRQRKPRPGRLLEAGLLESAVRVSAGKTVIVQLDGPLSFGQSARLTALQVSEEFLANVGTTGPKESNCWERHERP